MVTTVNKIKTSQYIIYKPLIHAFLYRDYLVVEKPSIYYSLYETPFKKKKFTEVHFYVPSRKEKSDH